MRLIDADALIVDIKTCLWDWESVNGIESKTVLNQTITDIENMPTIDAVQVVRCKDCLFNDGDGPNEDDKYWCALHQSFMQYCSEAEIKKETGGNKTWT